MLCGDVFEMPDMVQIQGGTIRKDDLFQDSRPVVLAISGKSGQNYASEWLSALSKDVPKASYFGVAELSGLPSFVRGMTITLLRRLYGGKREGPPLLLDTSGYFRRRYAEWKADTCLLVVVDPQRFVRYSEIIQSPNEEHLCHVRNILLSSADLKDCRPYKPRFWRSGPLKSSFWNPARLDLQEAFRGAATFPRINLRHRSPREVSSTQSLP